MTWLKTSATQVDSWWLPLLRIDGGSASSTVVDVIELLASLLSLSDDEILQRFAQGDIIDGWTVIDGKGVLNDSGVGWILQSSTQASVWKHNPVPIDISNIQGIFMELEQLFLFFRQLSPHTPSSQNTVAQYKKYIAYLKRLAPLFSPEERDAIASLSLQHFEEQTLPEEQNISWSSGLILGSREFLLAHLWQAGFLPEQAIIKLLDSKAIEWNSSVSLRAMLSFQGMMSYKKAFEQLSQEWLLLPHSEKPNITNDDSALFIRGYFSDAIEFLRWYIDTPDVYDYIRKTHGDETMADISHELDGLEDWFRTRILWQESGVSREAWEPIEGRNLWYRVFHEMYTALIRKLLELGITPGTISLSWVGWSE